jgi:hypothetical protein
VTASTIFFQLIRFFAKVPTTSTSFYANPYVTLHYLHCAFSSKTNYTYGSWRSANSHTESPTDREGRVYSFFIELDIDYIGMTFPARICASAEVQVMVPTFTLPLMRSTSYPHVQALTALATSIAALAP